MCIYILSLVVVCVNRKIKEITTRTYILKIVKIINLGGEIVCKRYSTVDGHVEFLSDNEFRQDENKDSRNYAMPKVIGVVLGVIENEKFIPVK